MVDNLINRTLAWEDEKRALFLYDGVSTYSVNLLLYTFLFSVVLYFLMIMSLKVRLVSILDDYKLTRKQKEEEKRRFRVMFH